MECAGEAMSTNKRIHKRLLRVCVGLLAVEVGIAVAGTWAILQLIEALARRCYFGICS